jgi:protein-S-isoprenylcysteine O-methyltransferase Ste14
MRIIGGILLVSTVLLIYFINVHGDDGDPYEAKVEIKVARSVDVLQVLSNAIVPFMALILLVLVPSVVYDTYLNIYFPGDTIVQSVGLILYVIAGALAVWSTRHLGRFDTGRIAVAQDHVLVDTGPYAYIRHPGYTAVILLGFTVMLLLLNILFIINLLVTIWTEVYRARLEEGLLSSDKGLGDQYRLYMKRTGMFFPRFRIRANQEV